MDPLERMHPEKDSTFAFMLAGTKRGHTNLFCLPKDITIREGRVYAHASEAKVSRQAPHYYQGPRELVSINDVDAVFIRKDPPFDRAYLFLTLCLERARGQVLILNDPQGLREANEKIYATTFSKWMPPTMVSADRDEIHAFVREKGGACVIKPLDGAGGAGVMLLRSDDKNARSIVDTLTAEGAQIAMVQAFLPKVVEGDKRVLLMDGEVLGSILRVPRGDDIRSNIHVGGHVEPTTLTAREQELVDDIAPRLKKDGLIFVGLDLIGGHLTEVNVTSPTGIQELARHTGSEPEAKVIEWIEREAAKIKA